MKRIALLLALAVAAAARPDPHSIPEGVREAADQGRYWRAARLLDRHLAGTADTTPATIVLAARLDAGWGSWDAVRQRLDGRDWLDTVADAEGLRLLGRAQVVEGELAAGAETLARYLAVADPGPEDEATVQLWRGLALARAAAATGPDGRGGGDASDPGTVDGALEAFNRAASLLPWFADWASYLAAEATAAAGRVAETDRRLTAAGDAGSEHWRLRVTAALAAGDTLAGREAALAATRRGSRTDRAEAWAELGRLRLAAGDTTRARRAFLRAMDVRGSVGAVAAARRVSELDPGPGEWRAIASVYHRHGNAVRAAEGFQRYLEDETAADRARVRLQLGRARFDAGRFRQAERGLLELAADSVADRVAAEALYLAARAQYRQGRSDDGQATFLRLAERYPDQGAVTRGLYLVADLKHDDLETEGPDGARVYYRRAADAAPELNEAGLSLMRLAGLEFLDGRYEAAAGIWEEYRELHPHGRRVAQATYWAARAYDRLGRDSLATARLEAVRERDPISFYGVRAAERLDRPVLDMEMGRAPPADPDVDAAVAAALRRVDLLAELDRRDDLVHEVESLRRRFQDGEAGLAGEYALAEALNERGYTLTGIGMGWTLYERDRTWNRRLLRLVYPFPFRTLVVPEAAERGLDPHLVAGVIRRESAFNPVVVSGAGARGLMQIVPATGRALARGAGLRQFETEMLHRPEVNVHLGVRFFAELVDRFDGDLPLVLAAYNAGPTRANRWRDLPEADDPELFMERIPYGETRDYVRHVLMHQAVYRALYPEVGGD